MKFLKKLCFFTILSLVAVLTLSACGDNTATTAPATTAAASATTAAPSATTAAASATTAAGTTSQGSGLKGDPNLKGEITVWAWNVASKALQSNMAGFNKLYPNVKVNFPEIGQSDVYDKLTTGLAGGGAGLPDVVQVESDHMDVYTGKFPNGFVDLTDKASKYEKDFDPSKWAQSKSKNHIFSIPWDSGPTGIFYRVDMFQKAGVDASKIETWDDWIEAGKKVQAANPGVKFMAIDFTKDDALYRMLLNQQGSFYFTQDGKINLTSPESVKAMTIIKKLNDAGLLTNVSGWDGVVGAMKNSQAATQLFGVWWSGTIIDSSPESKGKWDVILQPAIEKGGNRAASLGGSTLAIPKGSKNADAAWAFIEYNLATSEGQNNMLKNFGLWPSYLPAYSDPFYTQPQPFFNNKPIWQLFAKETPLIKPAYYTKDYTQAQTVSQNAQADILNGADPATALKKAADDLKNQTGRELAGG
ncbi:MAG: sugar ABC transporter substrate-binding protein [Chloroflexi bacterium]|nr:sugar ABC transporter substrate-binding protein [Chloroflexota bacterium]